MPTLLIRHPDGSTEEREVVGRLTVGADEGNDLVLRAGGVSQRHAQFFADGGELVLENVGSAAATLVDGETLGRPRKLKPGVRVLIGEYEVSLKPDSVSVRKLVPVPSPTLTGESLPAPVVRVVVAGGLVMIGLFLIVLWLLVRPEASTAVEVIEAPPQPCADLEPQRRIAREEPSERALAAANAVLECDPLNAEVLALKRQIERELKGAAADERGRHMVDLGRDDQALDAFKEIPEGTKAFLSARAVALEAADRSRKENSKACLTYARENKWLQAQPVCERAMELACQDPADPDKPDPVLAALLKAREANDPKGPKWKCPAFPLVKPMSQPEDPSKTLRTQVAARIADPQIAAAVVLYAEGKINEAIVKLQVVKEKSSKAAVHAQAEALRKDMANVDSLQKIGDGLLKKNELEKAAKTFREALELDARVVDASATRRLIQSEMASAAVRVGVPMANRPDLPRACATFRLGFEFYRGNIELNQALNDCSTNAKALLDAARSCADLNRALALAVPGDRIAEAVAAQKPQLRCP